MEDLDIKRLPLSRMEYQRLTTEIYSRYNSKAKEVEAKKYKLPAYVALSEKVNEMQKRIEVFQSEIRKIESEISRMTAKVETTEEWKEAINEEKIEKEKLAEMQKAQFEMLWNFFNLPEETESKYAKAKQRLEEREVEFKKIIELAESGELFKLS